MNENECSCPNCLTEPLKQKINSLEKDLAEAVKVIEKGIWAIRQRGLEEEL